MLDYDNRQLSRMFCKESVRREDGKLFLDITEAAEPWQVLLKLFEAFILNCSCSVLSTGSVSAEVFLRRPFLPDLISSIGLLGPDQPRVQTAATSVSASSTLLTQLLAADIEAPQDDQAEESTRKRIWVISF